MASKRALRQLIRAIPRTIVISSRPIGTAVVETVFHEGVYFVQVRPLLSNKMLDVPGCDTQFFSYKAADKLASDVVSRMAHFFELGGKLEIR